MKLRRRTRTREKKIRALQCLGIGLARKKVCAHLTLQWFEAVTMVVLTVEREQFAKVLVSVCFMNGSRIP